jgi:tRNA(fMet)-specific endonuclease VapC
MLYHVGLHPSVEIALCSVVSAELWYGAERSHNPTREHARVDAFVGQFDSLPFDTDAARIYARIRHHLATLGLPIGPYDLQIAAIALAHNLILVTHNTTEFSRVPGLTQEDWEIP